MTLRHVREIEQDGAVDVDHTVVIARLLYANVPKLWIIVFVDEVVVQVALSGKLRDRLANGGAMCIG